MELKKENDLLEQTLAIAENGYAAAYRFLQDAYVRGMGSDHTERFQTFGSGNVCPADGCYMHLQIHFVVPTFHWKPLWHNSLEAAGMNTSYSEGY